MTNDHLTKSHHKCMYGWRRSVILSFSFVVFLPLLWYRYRYWYWYWYWMSSINHNQRIKHTYIHSYSTVTYKGYFYELYYSQEAIRHNHHSFPHNFPFPFPFSIFHFLFSISISHTTTTYHTVPSALQHIPRRFPISHPKYSHTSQVLGHTSATSTN